jgi:integrase
MRAQTSMRERVQAYIAARRQAGYALKIEAAQLARFARFTDDSGYRGPLTVEIAGRWATASRNRRRLTAARRIEVLRSFARYCQRFDQATEIPPLRLFGPGHRRLSHHIYTDPEIHTLLDAAQSLHPADGLRPITCSTLFGLIAATGLRVGEAVVLKRTDVDLERQLLHIRNAKFGKARWVALHRTTVRALRQYARRRDHDSLARSVDAFFVFDRGRAVSVEKLEYAFRILRQKLGWRARGGHPHPRIHDLRHRFITCRLISWYREGIDIDQRMLALSTYVGHAHVTDTYWYVTATPQLMEIAAARFKGGCHEP